MFNEIYPETNRKVGEVISNLQVPSEERVREILEKSKENQLNLQEIAELLEVGRDSSNKKQFRLMRSFTHNNFRNNGGELREIAPVYLSSYCADRCGYCNYSADNRETQRARLSLSQLEEELIKGVLPLGSRVIEFTLATDLSFTPEKLSEYISKAKELLKGESGSGILLCSDYFSKQDYERLKEASLWGIVQWDETLDQKSYMYWHGKSKRKANFEERINTHDRAIQADLEVATGCLFGLSDYRYDVLMQIAKVRYLDKEYGKKPFVFGTPRLTPIKGVSVESNMDVTNHVYETSLMTYKIAEPEVARWLQTRELPELNYRNRLDGDIYTYKCGEVKPGGYSVNTSKIDTCSGGQFAVIETTKNGLPSEFNLNQAWIKEK